MRIITFRRIKEFSEQYPKSETALKEWYYKVRKVNWRNISDIKATFSFVDYVGNNRFVFNIKGNQYRLAAIVLFAPQKVYIRFIGTHAEYDKINCSTV